MKSSLGFLFYASLFLVTRGVTGIITYPPLNAAVEVDGQAIFNCTSNVSVPNWYLSTTREEVETSDSAGQFIVVNCSVQSGFTSDYDVDRPGDNNSCNLIIKAITMQQAGVYTCSDGEVGPSAILTVIERNASITVSSQPETVEGDRVTMSYTVTYNSSNTTSITPTIQPYLNWTDSDGNTVRSSPSLTENSVNSSISVTAGRQDIQPYTCHISFVINWPSSSHEPSFADNTPSSVSNPPNTSTINVLYAPIISSITTSQEMSVCPSNAVNITCNATANPAPTYSWIGPDSRNDSGETIEAVMSGTYSCNASNVIRGSGRSDTKETTLNVSEDCAQYDQTSTTQKIDECCQVIIIACSVIGAYILGNIIATVVFLVYYNRNIGFQLKLNDRFSWLRKMLSCMNEDVVCGCGWIFLSVCVFVLAGILFTISLVVIAKCSQGRRRSQNTVPHLHNPSYIRHSEENDEIVQDSKLGANDDDALEKMRDGRRISSQGKNMNNKEKQPNGKENWQPKLAKKNTNQSPLNSDNGITTPSSTPPNQQPTTAQGTVYSDLPVTNHNVQPEQYIEGNVDNNYSELNKT